MSLPIITMVTAGFGSITSCAFLVLFTLLSLLITGLRVYFENTSSSCFCFQSKPIEGDMRIPLLVISGFVSELDGCRNKVRFRA